MHPSQRLFLAAALALALASLAACQGLGRRTTADLARLWDFEAAESLVFPRQDEEREFSSLVADSKYLYLVSERVGTILRLDLPVGPASGYAEVAIWKRPKADYEGAALVGESLYLIDEHSDPEADAPPLLVKVALQRPGEAAATYPLRLKGLDCQDGHCLEGLAVVGDRLYLLDERDALPGGGCAGRLFVTTLAEVEAGSTAQAASFALPLPDCQWRYTDLYPTALGGQTYLIALKIRCLWNPEAVDCDEDKYVVEMINPEAGATVVSSYSFPEAAVAWWRMAPVSRDLEGVTIGPDGALYIVSDNRWHQARPRKSLLLRVPKR